MKKFFSLDMIIFSFLIIAVLLDLGFTLYSNHTILFFTTAPFLDLNATQGWAERGQWGDMLSGHFSALAFLAVAYTVYLQKQDLKNRSNFDSFKMALELINDIKENSILLTSKTNISLTSHLGKLLSSIDKKETLETIDFYSKSKHDILLIESFIDTFILLIRDLSKTQVNIIFKKLSLIETEYQQIGQMFFWVNLSFRLENSSLHREKEESIVVKKISSLAEEASIEIKKNKKDDYFECFKNIQSLEIYHNRIHQILFDEDAFATKRNPMNLFTLNYTCILDASPEVVCAFHTDTHNLPLITPPSIKVTIVKMEPNSVILDIKKFGITTRWEMALEKNCPHSIVDVMTKGPFASFRHERIFVAEGENSTRMDETITLSSPLPIFQSLFFWFVKRDMDAMFAYRHAKTKAYFLAK